MVRCSRSGAAQLSTSWHLYCVSSGRDAEARDQMRAAGADVVMLHERVRRRRCSRSGVTVVDVIMQPLFPGYVFARSESAGAPLACRDVMRVVTMDGEPAVVRASVVEELRSRADETGCVRSRDVSLVGALFEGAVGDIVQFAAEYKLCGLSGRVVSVDRMMTHGIVDVVVPLLGGERTAEVPCDVVVPVRELCTA